MTRPYVAPANGAFNVYYVSFSQDGRGYVGITGWSIQRRFERHCWNAKRGRPGAMYDAMRSHGIENFTVESLAEASSWEGACELERRFIEEFNTKLPNGFNMTNGGDGNYGYEYTDEVRARMSASGKAKRLTDTHKQRIGDNWRGRKHTPEAKEKMRVARAKRITSAETRLKMRNAKLGKPRPESSVDKMKGQKRTPEQKARMSAAMKGLKRSPEGRENIRKAAAERAARQRAEGRLPKPPSFAGRTQSEETRAKIAAARKAAWDRKKQGDSVMVRCTIPAGEYWLGDPGYAFWDKWQAVIAASDEFKKPAFDFEGRTLVVFPTLHGDGVYPSPAGSIAVDSALIGLVPVDAAERDPQGWSYRVVFPFDAEATSVKGVLTFGNIAVDTNLPG